MVGIDEAAQIAAGLPGVTEGTSYGNRAWFVGKKVFAWERSFRMADLRRFGDAPVPAGPIFAVRVAGLPEKDAVLAERTRGVFTIPHFDGYAAVLVQLEVVAMTVLRRLVTDAWLACADVATVEGCRVRRAAPRRSASSP